MITQLTIPIEEYKLSNGLHVVLHHDQSVPVAAVMIMYHVGSKNERPGKTGFAHLFEHMMFKGSAHVGDGEHFRLLQEVGANVNGSTSEDRTNYYEALPANVLELALYLESDRMGFLLPALTQRKLDNQRDVVKNERRQNYDNQPYGTAFEKLARALFPPGHPYSWPVIGSMEDLDAATMDDVRLFFSTYYAPNNASVVVTGHFNPSEVRRWIEMYFGPIPPVFVPAPPEAQDFSLPRPRHLLVEEQVRLPRLFLQWRSIRGYTRGDAVLDVFTDILSAGKNSRLYRSMVYERQIAQSVTAYQDGGELDGIAGIQISPKVGVSLKEMESVALEILHEALANGVTEREIQTAVNNKEASLVGRLATVLGKANGLATAYTMTGTAESYNAEMERYAAITGDEIQQQAATVFGAHFVGLSIVPNGRRDLAADPDAPPAP
jgi:zinc protease